jgi:PAS domain S-box-containing protein
MRINTIVVGVVLAGLSMLAVPAAAGTSKNVLIIRGESPELPGSRIIIDAIESAVQKDRASPAEFFLETIDLSRATGDEYERRLATLLEEKYRDVHLDLVVAFTEPAATFALSYRAKLFPNTPILIGLVERRLLDTVSLPPEAAVAFVALDTPATVRFALRAHPSVRQLYVVSGVSRFDRGWLAIVRDDLRAFEKGLTITYDTDSTREVLEKHVAALGPDTVVFYVSMTRDAGGNPERPVDVLESLRAVARAPIYGMASSNVGHGVVGGSLLDLDRHGRDLGAQAVRLLAGEHPAPVTTPAVAAVDWRELQRFAIAPALLPPGTIVANRQLTLWERDRRGLIAGGFIVLVESALILALFRIARRRRDTQRVLRARLDFDTSLLDLILALTSAPAERTASTLEGELSRMSGSMGIDRVRRWNFGDAEWDSPVLRAGQPALFRGLTELPPDVQRELKAAGWRQGWAAAVPLAGGGVVFGTVFCLCRADAASWRAGLGELHILGTTIANVLNRKRAEGQLEQSHRLRGAILESLPANVAVLDRDGIIIAVNRSWTRFGRENGVSSTLAIGEGVNYREACLQGLRAMIDGACRGESSAVMLEYRCDSTTRTRWFQMTATPLLRPEGGAIIKHLDVSEQKMTEIALRESEDRFRRIADGLPVAVWMSESDGLCSYFNQKWLDLTGRTFEQEAGVGWLENVHADDRRASMDTYMRAFDAREPFSMEYRIRRHDGEFRWLLDSGRPRYGSDGVFHGYVGGCVDITDAKHAEHALRYVNRKLILAQEDERRRIARDLHDHLSQQLALLAIDLQQISVSPPKSPEALRDALQEAWGRTAEIASDVHAISHRLHPSKMEALGLVATIRAHCRDVSRQSLSVHFSEKNVPAGISPDVSLGLFRVLEEALTNVARHSGAREAHVTLDFDRDVVLRVSDTGKGFKRTSKLTSGLGLVSMRERVEALGGKLSIASRPGHGTVVEARVPPPRPSSSQRQTAESA